MNYRFDQFELDTQNYQLRQDGLLVEVEPKVFDLLAYLVANRDKLVSRNELFDNLWSGQVVSDSSLSNLIKAARKAIGDNGQAQARIKTVHGRGFQFITPTEVYDQVTEPLVKTSIRKNGISAPSVVVLPFQNISENSDNDYFVAGITEGILTGLSRYREIVVMAIGSSIKISEQTNDAAVAARQLDVEYALRGSVLRSGDRVRITASLVEGESGHQVWADQYDHVLDDIFTVQDEVVQRILTMLVGKIEQSDRERSVHKETENLTAYEALLRGRHLFRDWGGPDEDILQARKMFELAIELDPGYAAAYAGLAATYEEAYCRRWPIDLEQAAENCFKYAQKAIELDAQDSFAHMVLSFAYWHLKSDFELARRQLETAIKLNPNYYWNYCYGCWLLACNGELDASVVQANEAIRLNPLLPGSCLWMLGFTEYLSKHYLQAIEYIGQIAQLEPESHACLAACYAQLDRTEEARIASEEFSRLSRTARMNDKQWRKYWDQFFNFKDQASINHLIEGLDKAGLVRR